MLLDFVTAGHVSKVTWFQSSHYGNLQYDTSQTMCVSIGEWCDWLELCVMFWLAIIQVVSRGNDQVSITSKFEAREDAGEVLMITELNYHYH